MSRRPRRGGRDVSQTIYPGVVGKSNARTIELKGCFIMGAESNLSETNLKTVKVLNRTNSRLQGEASRK